MVGQIQQCLAEWKNIGTPTHVLDWIEKGIKFPFTSYPDSFYLLNRQFSPKEEEFLDDEITNLVDKGVLRKCDTAPLCVSPIGCVPKKEGFNCGPKDIK